MATGSQPAAAGVQLDRGSWVQPRFGLGGYFPEFIGAKHAPYSLLAEANFSVALMGSDVSACKAAGLGCISLAGPPSTKGVDEPALWGYNVGDEPGPPPRASTRRVPGVVKKRSRRARMTGWSSAATTSSVAWCCGRRPCP